MQAPVHRQRGITLLETVVGAALMLVVFMGIAAAFKLSVDVLTNNKARAGAIALVNERIEYIRSLTYAQLGTAGGIPSGSLAQTESVALNGVSYTRRTLIEYVDDPGDGVGAADSNHITEDYKVAKVDVSWSSRTGVRHIILVTRVSPTSGVETACTTACGTLAITIVNAAAQAVSSAQVHVVNTTTNPAIDVTTYTDINGLVNLVGAPAASNYQITVSKTGYSSDQTYNSSGQNPNPTPGPLTVSGNLTTSATFRIDLLSMKNIYTLTQVLAGTWNETFADSTKIASSTNIDVAGGSAELTGPSGSYPSYGELQSITIGPSSLARWKTLTLVHAKPAQTNITYHLYEGTGSTLIPDAQVYGNSTGLATSSSVVDLSNISTSTYPSVRLDATFSSSDPTATPSVDSYAIAYDYGPIPLPNIALTMQGVKTIGSGPPAVYKYLADLNSGATASVILSNIEWDTYTVAVPSASGYDIASSCNPQPEYLAPGTTASTYLYLAAHTANSLLVDVSSGGVYLPNASVSLWKSGTATTTQAADGCAQAFFGGLTASTYWVQVAALGHATSTNGNVNVSGTSRVSVTLN